MLSGGGGGIFIPLCEFASWKHANLAEDLVCSIALTGTANIWLLLTVNAHIKSICSFFVTEDSS